MVEITKDPALLMTLFEKVAGNDGQITKEEIENAEISTEEKEVLSAAFQEQAKPSNSEDKYRLADEPTKMTLWEFKQGVNRNSLFKEKPFIDVEQREADKQIVAESGLFKALKVRGPGGDSVFGDGISNALNSLRGPDMDVPGNDLGYRGTGPGGGGSALGIGGLGTHGSARGTGGFANVELNGRPNRTRGQNEIDSVVNGANNKFIAAFQEQNLGNIEGTINVQFTINRDGTVRDISFPDSTLKNKKVTTLLTTILSQLKFEDIPKGGSTEVTYPLVFQQNK